MWDRVTEKPRCDCRFAGDVGNFELNGGNMKLAIQLSEAQEKKLSEIAGRLKVPVESLAEAAVRELVAKTDDDFDLIAKRLLEKNRELYERLG